MSIFDHVQSRYEQVRQEEMSLQEYLEPVSYTHLTLPTICSV